MGLLAVREARYAGLVIHLTRPPLRWMFGSAGKRTRPAGCCETRHDRVLGHHQLSQGNSTHSHWPSLHGSRWELLASPSELLASPRNLVSPTLGRVMSATTAVVPQLCGTLSCMPLSVALNAASNAFSAAPVSSPCTHTLGHWLRRTKPPPTTVYCHHPTSRVWSQ